MNGDTKILIYEASLSFLKAACIRRVPGRSLREVRILQRTMEDHITSMTCNSVLSGIIESLPCRKRVLELSNKLELTNDPDLRTAIRADEERIATFLVSILSSKSDEETVLRLEGDSAQHFLDVVQETLDRGFIVAQEHTKMALRIIRKLSALCDRLPSSLFIVGVTGQDEHPTFGGGYGDIYRASYGNQRVALKRMRHFLRGSDLRRMRLKFCREALVWKDLHHPHILPFLGIDANSFPSSLCMVSPWMEHGTVLNYLKTHGHANLDKLLYEIAQGLEYLHSYNVVHGDLRGTNILIKEDWSACLTDFGLSILSDATSTMSTNRGGSAHWMAPELLDPDRFGIKFARTPATDVYAFGCVCIELYTERPPFSNVSEAAALLKVINGERPERPPGPPAMSDTLWQHVTEFWAENPTTRPSTQSVVQAMTWPPTDPKHSRPQLRFGPRPVPLVPQSPPGLTPVKDSFPPDITSTAAKTAIPSDTPSSVPLSTDDESEKNWLLPPVSNGPPSSRLLDLLSVLADGGIGTEELVGAEPQWPEVILQEAPLVNPEARGLTAHAGTDTVPVWPDELLEPTPPVDPEAREFNSPSPRPVRRRRRSLISITTVVDGEGIEGVFQPPSGPRPPSPIHVQDLVGIDHQWPEVKLQEAEYPSQRKGKARERSGMWPRRSQDKSLSPRFKLDLPLQPRSRSGSRSAQSNALSGKQQDPSVISSLSHLSLPSLPLTTLSPSPRRPYPQPPLVPFPSVPPPKPQPLPPDTRNDDRGSVREYDSDDSILGDGTARLALRSLSPRTAETEQRARTKRRPKKDKQMTFSTLAKPSTPADTSTSHRAKAPDSLFLCATGPFQVDVGQTDRRTSRVRFEDAFNVQASESQGGDLPAPGDDRRWSTQSAPSRPSDHLRNVSFLDFASSSEGSSSHSFGSLGAAGPSHWSTGGSSNIASLVPPPQPRSRWSVTTTPGSELQPNSNSSSDSNFPFPVSLPSSPHHPEGTFMPPPHPFARQLSGAPPRGSALRSLNAHPSDLITSIPMSPSPTESTVPMWISDLMIHFRQSDSDEQAGGSHPPAHRPLPLMVSQAQALEDTPYVM